MFVVRWSGLLCLYLLACGPTNGNDVPDGCFPPDPWEQARRDIAEYREDPDYQPAVHDDMVQALGFCEYGPAMWGDAFDGYETRAVNQVGVCFPADASECAECPSGDIVQDLRDAYNEHQDIVGCSADPAEREILEFELGCVSHSDSGDQCCYSALVASRCSTSTIATD